MVYIGDTGADAQVPGIAGNIGAARAFVQRLVMQTVFGVLESQARNALLPNAKISSILDQLSINVSYEPMECPGVSITRMEEVKMDMTRRRCIIVGSTVTAICTAIGNNGGMCDTEMMNGVTITSVNTTYTSISGSLMTTNIITSNCSRMIWQAVVNRAVRMLASGLFASNFFSAIATVGGN
ncbi:hypothetical protein KIN20_027741 [Parelaphostrongylus tenuis]|uniref:Uncharacterized protein n=1 Tax=Parelaphostrongylus tenuis TaxID=148309 RepID=A0AAD5QZW3_PARTN|nr:hypothetical protein KIN20_027741 [Parelaphostrongylus tenuis]